MNNQPAKFTSAWFAWIGSKGGKRNTPAQVAARAKGKKGAGRPVGSKGKPKG